MHMGTRLPMRIERRGAQTIITLQMRAGTQRDDFGVGRRIVTRNGPIPPFADHLAAKHQQRADGHLAVSGSALRKK